MRGHHRLLFGRGDVGGADEELGDVIGSRPAASMFLNATRAELSKPQIRRLAAHFKMDAGFFF